MADVLNELKIYQKHCKIQIAYHATKSSYFTHRVFKISKKLYCLPERAFHFSSTSTKCNVVLGSRIEKRKKSNYRSGCS